MPTGTGEYYGFSPSRSHSKPQTTISAQQLKTFRIPIRAYRGGSDRLICSPLCTRERNPDFCRSRRLFRDLYAISAFDLLTIGTDEEGDEGTAFRHLPAQKRADYGTRSRFDVNQRAL